jgi:hypothetical protein
LKVDSFSESRESNEYAFQNILTSILFELFDFVISKFVMQTAGDSVGYASGDAVGNAVGDAAGDTAGDAVVDAAVILIMLLVMLL